MKIILGRKYKYIKWPVECTVQLTKIHYNSGGQRNYEFDIIDRVKYHDYGCDSVMATPFELTKIDMKDTIFEIDEIIKTVKDIQ